MGGKVIFKKGTEKYWKEASLSKSNGIVETVEEGSKLEKEEAEEWRRGEASVWLSTRFLQESNRLRLLFREQFRSDGGWRGGPLAAEPTRMSIPAICHDPQKHPRQASTVKHSWSSSSSSSTTMNGTRKGGDGETDDFLKFLRVFDETEQELADLRPVSLNASLFQSVG